MESLIQDLRYALRMLRKTPSLTTIAVLTLALGIGSTTAIFSVVYGVLLRPLPFEKPDQIVRLWEVNGSGHNVNFTDPNFEDMRQQNHSLEGLAEFGVWPESVSGGSQPMRTNVAPVSHDFFSLMHVAPVRGRSFVPEEEHFGAAPAALVSYGYWKEYLGEVADLSTAKLTIENQAVSVVGVLPAGFQFPDKTAIWVPRDLYERYPSRSAHNWHLIGRLRDGVSSQQAHADLAAIAHQIKQQYGQDADITDVSLARLQDALTGEIRPALIILLGAVAFLLLIACANVANLLLAQGASRQREMAIRTAIGAGRARLVRQSLVELLLLSLVGGLAGVLFAGWGVVALIRLAPPNLPRLEDVAINLPVLVFAFGISLFVAVALGVSKALRATTGDVLHVLAEHGRSQSAAPGGKRLGQMIVAGQLAITLILLTGAGLLGRSMLKVLSIDPGFRTEHIVTVDLALSSADKDAEKIQRIQFLGGLMDKLRAIPGVQSAGGTGCLPFTGGPPDGTFYIMNPGEQPPQKMEELGGLFHNEARTGTANYVGTSEGYFRTLGIPLERGRWFDDHDTTEAPHVALINQSLARERWPKEDPVGRMIEFGNMDGDLRPLTIVGVVGDAREDSLEAPPSPTVYVNYRQRPQGTQKFTAVLRSETDPAAVISAAREIVHALDPNVPPNFGTFDQVLAKSLNARQFNLTLVGVFSGAALLLAVIGLYGVMAYAVMRRTGEFGIRIALGATSGNILRLVLRQGVVTVIAGVAVGLAGALVLTRTLQSLLFGLSATDPLTFACVALVLVLVALVACYFPARRATEVDPVVALRYE